jgi:TPP-dependent pyruvate/acetoin dehydrogenase alpha subunit
LRADVRSDIDRAIDAAWAAPDPDPETLRRHVFSEEPRR